MEKKLDLRIQKTYQALHNAFTTLLEEKTFEEITVNELCDAAMIRRTTFYKHFADKYEYFQFYLTGISETFKSHATADTLFTDPQAYSVNMLHEMFQFVKGHKKLVDGLRNSNMTSFLYQSLQDIIAKELANVFSTLQGNPLTPKNELMISFYAGGLINVVYWWMNHPDDLNEEEISEFLVKSIAPPKKLDS